MRTLVLATLVTLGLASSARAEFPQGIGSGGSCRQEDDSPVVTRVEIINGKRTLVIEKEIVICGHPARPAVAYVTSAKDVEYTWTQLTENLAAKIVDSVNQLGGRK